MSESDPFWNSVVEIDVNDWIAATTREQWDALLAERENRARWSRWASLPSVLVDDLPPAAGPDWDLIIRMQNEQIALALQHPLAE